MKTTKPESTPGGIVGEVRLARIRLARAESQLATAKERARLARRRRKEAKLAARRAKKQARLAKTEVAEAKLVLAQAEDKLARLKHVPFRISPRKTPVKQAAAAPRGAKSSRPVAVRSRASVKRRKPVITAKSRPGVRSAGNAALRPVKVPRDFETPGAIVSSPVGMPMDQILKGVEDILGAGQPTAANLVPIARPTAEPPPSPSQTVT